jgi:protein-export membrane protein SecD
MTKIKIFAVIILILGLLVGFFVFSTESNPDSNFHFKLGLDLSGGTHLLYTADVSDIETSEVRELMGALRDVIERRVNLFGVSEPIVQVEEGGIFNSGEERLIIELPGVTDIEEAIGLIGKTPLLEFKLPRTDVEITEDTLIEDVFISTGLTGRMVKRANLQFEQGSGGVGLSEPVVILQFNKEGEKLFARLTRENIGREMAIFLDGELKSAPVIQQEILGGSAQISGNFTPEEARTLVRDLNFGALPVPIELSSTQSIGPTLGAEVLSKGVRAGLWGILLISLFLILWYRLPGFLASLSLTIYVILMLTIFKLIPVTLTAAGIAGFILSIGMAVDANILIFERIKEELGGKTLEESIRTGFARAWLSIRDSNISSIITAIILFWFGTSLVKGFALTFGLGVLISMITAITISRTLLLSVGSEKYLKLFNSGVK